MDDVDRERRLLAVMVTHRRPQLLAAHLEVLAAQTRVPDHLVVVDNDPDQRNEAAVDAYRGTGHGADYVAAPANLGPAGGIALGLEWAMDRSGPEDWLLLLDDDDPPAAPDLVARLWALATTATTDDRVAAVGIAGAPFDWRQGRLRRLADDDLVGSIAVDEIGGNQLPMYRAAAVREVGVFDASLFFGFDDLDYGLRLRRAGWELRVSGEMLADARAHWGRTGDVATAGSADQPAWRRYYTVRNLVAILRKHGATRAALVAGARSGLVGPALRIRRSPIDGLAQVVMGARGFVDGWRGRLGPTVAPRAKPGAR